MTPRLTDTHCHLSMLTHDEVDTIVNRARSSGVYRQITVSTSPENWLANQAFSKKYPDTYYSLGFHPHEAKLWESHEKDFLAFFPNKKPPEKCVAIGEMGLDFYYNLSPKETQIEVFEKQLRLAKELDLPIIIHCRDAFDLLFESIKRVGTGSRPGVMHCFTGNTDQAKASIDLGLKISFSGIVTFNKAKPIQDAAQAIPLSEILIETDCPFLAPVPLRGKPNEPANITHTATFIANLRGISLEEFAATTSQTAEKLFRL